jgi:hypothetical protein
MKRYVGVLAVLAVLFIYVVLGRSYVLFQHEHIHSALNARYGVDSSINYSWSLLGIDTGTTYSDVSNLSSSDDHELFVQQGYAEVVGYNTQLLCSFIMLSIIVLTIAMFLIRHDVYLMRGERR